MKIELRKASLSDAEILWKMQKAAFAPLYEIYRDEGSPAMEPLSRTQERLEQSETSYYFILADGAPAGAIRVRDWQGERPKVISPLFVLPDFQGAALPSGRSAKRRKSTAAMIGCWIPSLRRTSSAIFTRRWATGIPANAVRSMRN